MSKHAAPEASSAKFYVIANLAEAFNNEFKADAEHKGAIEYRDRLIRQARSMGVSLSEIAAIGGISKSRVQQIDDIVPTPDDENASDVDADDDQRAVS